MELLDLLEEKIILTLETVELLQMENDELKQEVAALKKQNTGLGSQQSEWETKVSSMLSQFDAEVAEELELQAAQES
ncbi:MAG: cell division protein ZapB [Pseudomonadales bacterium]|nr:cell division protein ZapB [Pseudomonadales bacterium]